MSGYITIPGVKYVEPLPSGKSFKVVHDSTSYIVPNFAVHDDSEIWEGSVPGDSGKLKVREDIAIEKGLVDTPSSSLGGGLPLKRHKLPPAPDLIDSTRLKTIANRWDACSASTGGWQPHPKDPLALQLRDGDPKAMVGMFQAETDTEFAAYAPDDINDLLNQVQILQEWVAAALKTQQRRKRK